MSDDLTTGREAGPEEAREKLASLLANGNLSDEVEDALLRTAGECGISFSDDEVVGIIKSKDK